MHVLKAKVGWMDGCVNQNIWEKVEQNAQILEEEATMIKIIGGDMKEGRGWGRKEHSLSGSSQ